MLDAGRQRVVYSSPLTTSCFSSVTPTKTQLLQHGNTFGMSFVATERGRANGISNFIIGSTKLTSRTLIINKYSAGFVMTNNNELEASCADYNNRRQEALDHGQKLTLEEIHELPVAKEIQLPSIAYWIALSPDELMVAVAYADSVALFEVAHIVEAVRRAFCCCETTIFLLTYAMVSLC